MDYQPEPAAAFSAEQTPCALTRSRPAAHDEARREYHAELPLVGNSACARRCNGV